MPAEAISASRPPWGACTVGSAYAAFEEGPKGTLASGQLADFVVLDQDLLAIERDGMGQVGVLATVVRRHGF